MNDITIKSKPTQTYFFQGLIYPTEFKHSLDIISQIGYVLFSPLHFDNGLISLDLENTRYFKGKPCHKAHYHFMVRAPSKITFNSFQCKLANLLNNDFSGIAINEEESLVHNVHFALRYFWHLDNPNKQQFNLDTCISSNIPNTYLDSVAKAFDIELLNYITNKINTREIVCINQIANIPLLCVWLRQGRNAYLVDRLLLQPLLLRNYKNKILLDERRIEDASYR